MGFKGINKRSKIAWKYEISKINQQAKREELKEYLRAEKSQKGIDRDSHNRQYIATKIKQYISEGIKEDEAIEKVIQEEKEVVDQFNYLTKNGLDIRKIFSNWARNPHYGLVDNPFLNKDEGR